MLSSIHLHGSFGSALSGDDKRRPLAYNGDGRVVRGKSSFSSASLVLVLSQLLPLLLYFGQLLFRFFFHLFVVYLSELLFNSARLRIFSLFFLFLFLFLSSSTLHRLVPMHSIKAVGIK